MKEKVRIMYMKAHKHIYNGHENGTEVDETRGQPKQWHKRGEVGATWKMVCGVLWMRDDTTDV